MRYYIRITDMKYSFDDYQTITSVSIKTSASENDVEPSDR